MNTAVTTIVYIMKVTVNSTITDTLCVFIIKFPYHARSDWLKQRVLSEIRERVDDIKLAFKFLLRNLDKFDPNYKHPLCDSDKSNINELFLAVNMAHRDHS